MEEKEYVWIDAWVVLRERVVPSRRFESLLRGIFSGFPLASHLALPGSESIFGISQGPPT